MTTTKTKTHKKTLAIGSVCRETIKRFNRRRRILAQYHEAELNDVELEFLEDSAASTKFLRQLTS